MMLGSWTILNDLRVRRYADGRQEPNGDAVPLWERWEVRTGANATLLEAEQVAVADAREGPWRPERLGPFPMMWSGVGTWPGGFVIRNADGSLIITGESDGAVMRGTAKTFRPDHVKVEEFSGWIEEPE